MATKLMWLSVPIVVITMASFACADVLNFTAHTLAGEQEVPPVETPAIGEGVFVIDLDANTVDYNITFSGLVGNETNAHIHGFADRGQNAAVEHVLPLGSPKIGTWHYDEAEEEAILDGLTYVNIHTDQFLPGEIRGQIEPFFDLELNAEDITFHHVGNWVEVEILVTLYSGWNDDDAGFWEILIEDCEGGVINLGLIERSK
jgi:hypothetical protein